MIFLSWSGSSSRQIAEKLKRLINKILPEADIYLSTEAIHGGELWFNSVHKALENGAAGILIVTAENIARPWIHFEAGALATKLEQSRVMPLLCGVSIGDLKDSPLTHFQAAQLDKNGVFEAIKLVRQSMNSRIADNDFEESFTVWWAQKGGEILSLIPISETLPSSRKETSLDDIAVMVEQVENQIRNMGKSLSGGYVAAGILGQGPLATMSIPDAAKAMGISRLDVSVSSDNDRWSSNFWKIKEFDPEISREVDRLIAAKIAKDAASSAAQAAARAATLADEASLAASMASLSAALDKQADE